MIIKPNQNLKVIELRNYLLKPRMRENFIKYFENHFLESQFDLGGFVLGQFRIKDEPDSFFWMRGFADMPSRLAFLRGFYEQGETWKTRGAGANEMMLEWNDTYLLKPLNGDCFNSQDLVNEKGFFVINFYFAEANQLDKLTDFYEAFFLPRLENKATLWTSETTANEFLRHPIIQDPDLLVSITAFEDESGYERQSKQSAQIRIELREFLAREKKLIIYPTDTSFMGGCRLNGMRR